MDKFLKQILKSPLSKKEIIEKREKVLKSIKEETITINTIEQLVKSINKEFFQNLLELPKIKEGYIIENQSVMAFYVVEQNTVYVNFNAINQTKDMLHKFSKLNIQNQNLNLDIQDNIIQAVTYVLEHELCHLAIHKYLPSISTSEINHGPTFRKLVKHLLGHNWGDFAFIHIDQYIQSKFNKKKFFELLNNEEDFDDEYREEVYKRLWKATTLSNFFKLFFRKKKTRKNKRLE